MTIPLELQALPQWIIWHRETDKNGELTKIPYNPNFPDKRASSTDPSTWGTYEQTTTCTHPNKSGIGFVFNGNGICGIDLDHCLLDGQLTKYNDILEKILSYTEYSPSKNGLHILFKCDEQPYDKGRKKDDIEIYSTGRFFTVTGDVFQNRDKLITVPVSIVRETLSPYLDKLVKKPQSLPVTATMEDEQIIKLASSAKNGEKFKRLYRGDSSGYLSQSEADSAFAAILLFYTYDALQVARIMQSSGLYRDKLNRQDYLIMTIENARQVVKEHYELKRETIKPAESSEEITEKEIKKIQNENSEEFKELPELPDGFFKDYVAYGIRMSYAYPALHFGNALAIISLIAGRTVAMVSTGAKIFTNVYISCIGQTSTSGKSTACDIMFFDFFPLVRQDGIIEDLTKKVTPQGLLQRLSKVPVRLWYYDECSEFFSDIQNKWAESLSSILCSVYDGRPVSYGLSEGKNKTSEYRADGVFLTCVWNTTDSEMEARARWDHVTNGFLPRFMWFWLHGSNKPRKNREVLPEDIVEKERLLQKMQGLRNIILKCPGECMIKFNPHDMMEEWRLNDNLAHLEKKDELHRIATARLVPQGYKIAMLLSLMDEDLIPTLNSVTYPIALKIPDKYAALSIRICEESLDHA
jgi:hypothetical protein